MLLAITLLLFGALIAFVIVTSALILRPVLRVIVDVRDSQQVEES